jgi:hypothetical protein
VEVREETNEITGRENIREMDYRLRQEVHCSVYYASAKRTGGACSKRTRIRLHTRYWAAHFKNGASAS